MGLRYELLPRLRRDISPRLHAHGPAQLDTERGGSPSWQPAFLLLHRQKRPNLLDSAVDTHDRVRPLTNSDKLTLHVHCWPARHTGRQRPIHREVFIVEPRHVPAEDEKLAPRI